MILDYSFAVLLNFRSFRNFCNKCFAVFRQVSQIVFKFHKFRKTGSPSARRAHAATRRRTPGRAALPGLTRD